MSNPIEPSRSAGQDRLWNDSVDASTYADTSRQLYQQAVFEQYKLYVEMADRISNRRSLTNTFFLTMNTAVITAIGAFWGKQPMVSWMLMVVLLLALLLQCAAWFWLVRSYRLLNGAKYEVIGLLEKRLPASPYWGAEWTALGEGKDWRKYLPLTHLEQWVPITFGVVYVLGFVAFLAT